MNIEIHKVLFSQINIVSAIRNICPFNLIKGIIKILPNEGPSNHLTNTDLFKPIQWNNINFIDIDVSKLSPNQLDDKYSLHIEEIVVDQTGSIVSDILL